MNKVIDVFATYIMYGNMFFYFKKLEYQKMVQIFIDRFSDEMLFIPMINVMKIGYDVFCARDSEISFSVLLIVFFLRIIPSHQT